MEKFKNLHIENDKTNSPFLLAASFSGLVKFGGSYTQGGILYWQFEPKDVSVTLLEQLRTKTEPHIPAKDLFDAIETFWRQVSEVRNGEIKYGEPKR